jgi:hypothetical protein
MMYGFLDPAAFDEDLAYRQERRPSFPSRLALGLIFVLSTLGKNNRDQEFSCVRALA